eukprot:3889561-Ditylum_brightwellii.AAC.1
MMLAGASFVLISLLPPKKCVLPVRPHESPFCCIHHLPSQTVPEMALWYRDTIVTDTGVPGYQVSCVGGAFSLVESEDWGSW